MLATFRSAGRSLAGIATIAVVSVAGAAPLPFDGTPRLVEPFSVDGAVGSGLIALPPRTASAQGMMTQSMRATGSLRVEITNAPAPVVFPAVPFTVPVVVETPGSLPRSFAIPKSVFLGTQRATFDTGFFAGAFELRAKNAAINVLGSGFSSAATTPGAYSYVAERGSGVGAQGQVLSGGRLCLGDSGCTSPLVDIPWPFSQVGLLGTATLPAGTAWAVPWATGTAVAARNEIPSPVTIVAHGARGANSISLVSAFSIHTGITQSIGVARLKLNFHPPGTTTTSTTLPPINVDVGIAATKLVVVDKLDAASKAKTVFVAKTPDAAKGPGTDPNTIGAVLDVSYTGAAGQFVVPEGALSGDAGWKTNKDTVAKFVNKAAPGGPTGAKVAVIKPTKLLKLVGKSLGDTPLDITMAGAPDASGVDVVYTVTNGGSTVRHCANFAQSACAYKQIAGDTGSKLVCKGGTPVACSAAATCDVFAQDCPAGQGCYPTFSVPETQCTTAGPGGNGAICATASDCQAGFACFNNDCHAICELGGPSTCGLFSFCTTASGTGIPNFGACF